METIKEQNSKSTDIFLGLSAKKTEPFRCFVGVPFPVNAGMVLNFLLINCLIII